MIVRNSALAAALLSFPVNAVVAQNALAAHVVNTSPSVVPPTASVEMLVLPRDTPVHLMVLNEVSTKTSAAGQRFPLRVNAPVEINGVVVLPTGARGWGEVTNSESSGNLGKSGRLSARLLYVEVAGKNVPITGERSAKGKSGTAETIMGVLGLGLLGLLAKGNNAKIKAGELMTAFTSEDVQFPASGAPTPAAR